MAEVSERIRVLVVDDDALVRAGLSMLLTGADDIRKRPAAVLVRSGGAWVFGHAVQRQVFRRDNPAHFTAVLRRWLAVVGVLAGVLLAIGTAFPIAGDPTGPLWTIRFLSFIALAVFVVRPPSACCGAPSWPPRQARRRPAHCVEGVEAAIPTR